MYDIQKLIMKHEIKSLFIFVYLYLFVFIYKIKSFSNFFTLN